MKLENFPLTFTEDAVRERYINQNYGLRFPFSVRSQVSSNVLQGQGARCTISTGIIIPQALIPRLNWEPTPHLFRGTYTMKLGEDNELQLVATLGTSQSHRFGRGDRIGTLTLRDKKC